jgi:hypothetical protein
MKKLFFSLLVVLILTITACSGSEEVKATLPEGFSRVTFDEEVDGNYADASVLKHTDTGCHYIYIEGYKAGGVIQMFVKENGVSVPYCD